MSAFLDPSELLANAMLGCLLKGAIEYLQKEGWKPEKPKVETTEKVLYLTDSKSGKVPVWQKNRSTENFCQNTELRQEKSFVARQTQAVEIDFSSRTASGRRLFLQRDPLGYVDGMGLYTYVGNNPVNWVDPMGTARGKYDPGNSDTWHVPSESHGYWEGGQKGQNAFIYHSDHPVAKSFPQGVPFNNGLADLRRIQVNPNIGGRNVAGNVTIRITGNSDVDTRVASQAFAQSAGVRTSEVRSMIKGKYTWHHNSNGQMVLVPMDIHRKIAHTGSAAAARFKTGALKGGSGALKIFGALFALGAIQDEGLFGIVNPIPTTYAGDSSLTGSIARSNQAQIDSFTMAYHNRYDLSLGDRASLLDNILNYSPEFSPSWSPCGIHRGWVDENPDEWFSDQVLDYIPYTALQDELDDLRMTIKKAKK